MGILSSLFGSGRKQVGITFEPFSDRFAHIKSLNFFGQFAKSPSGQWIILWSDSDEQNHRGGHRDKGHGRYVLFDALRGAVVLQGRIERPNNGNVANDGTFSLEDWQFGSGLSGTLHVFSSAGDELVKRKFDANLYNSAISESGRFAICQTANAPSDDGNKLTAFDVRSKTELFSVSPTTGWAEKYVFDEETPRFGVSIRGVGTFHYDKTGQLIDPAAFEAALLSCGSYSTVLLAAEKILGSEQLTEEAAHKALQAGQRALALGAETDPRWKPVALKVQGLAHEHLKHFGAALAAYEDALRLNPKIGLKRKADALRKRSGI